MHVAAAYSVPYHSYTHTHTHIPDDAIRARTFCCIVLLFNGESTLLVLVVGFFARI